MNLEATVRAAVREYNADFRTRAWVAVGMGVLTSLLVYAFILMVCFFFFCLSSTPWYLVGTGVFILFFGLSWWSCLRGADPIGSVTPPDEDDLGAIKLATAATGIPFSPRHAAAGFAGVIMHGPASIIDGREMLRSQLPESPEVVGAAAKAFGDLLEGQTMPVASVKPAAALVLLRTGLAKPAGRGRGAVVEALVVSVKGREAVGRP
jgi:hypothetical protein